ncbi:pyridoxamine 5'-phosphate oxidase family protein [Aureimonas phyllosphaerae]|uniref:General stress protein 26 n=1 Tax=Aureimonas phyllosphaerae TaxID=1166078 RepID=A0A7W6FWD8_9HYPH|nr:pyridoxamine 5'-phosphate oxidase family protein [Aureimonas phyllosphaerae]MBB3937800.1 general stress protein 26 [Aureimonas phyllosphaerae]MBB3961869.1 general stress protein 26 [Aureimonas phyllosphaerae]SFF51080.1 General stress protein 26 [Aureimonas phyllosphaerae]
MADMTLKDISDAMADIDFCMLSTHTENGDIAARPMSNNGDVAYEGDSYFFTYEEARTVSDIERDPRVGLGFQGKKGLLGRPPMFISVEGRAELIRDKAAFEAHWTKDLEYWFKDGVDTPNLVLIKVHATRIHFWNGQDEGEVPVR